MQQTATVERAKAIDAIRLHEAERYLENQRFEEKTDLGERLGYHVSALIRYKMRAGSAYAVTDTKDRPFHDQTFEAKEAGRWKFTGENAFEAERLRLEHEEALLVDAFGRGEINATVLIKVSKVPDAVVDGSASVNGYRKDLMRSFVRLYYREPDGEVSCLLFSLDGNNTTGLKNIAPLIHMNVAERPSEVVLGDAALLNWESEDIATQVEMLAEEIKLRYDEGVLAETDEETYAGSHFTDRANAMQVIDKHPDLFEEHWRAISEIQGRALSARDGEQFLEHMRRKTAAAIKLREGGESVGSIGDSSVEAEASSGEYGRECATNGMNQTENSDKELLKDWKRKTNCPICGAKDVWAEKKGETIKGLDCGCELNVCTGRYTIGHGVAQQTASKQELPRTESKTSLGENKSSEASGPARDINKEFLNIVRALYGSNARPETRIVTGGTQTNIVLNTGHVVARDVNRDDYVLAS